MKTLLFRKVFILYRKVYSIDIDDYGLIQFSSFYYDGYSTLTYNNMVLDGKVYP